jgi:hypothetical protein
VWQCTSVPPQYKLNLIGASRGCTDQRCVTVYQCTTAIWIELDQSQQRVQQIRVVWQCTSVPPRYKLKMIGKLSFHKIKVVWQCTSVPPGYKCFLPRASRGYTRSELCASVPVYHCNTNCSWLGSRVYTTSDPCAILPEYHHNMLIKASIGYTRAELCDSVPPQ